LTGGFFRQAPPASNFDMTDATVEAVQGSNFADSITGSEKNDIILGGGGTTPSTE